MNNYIKELMETAKEMTEKVFCLADRIAGLCQDVFDEPINEMQFDPSTLSYILTVGPGIYRIKIDLNDGAVKVTAQSVRSNVDVAFCYVGVNGAFKIECGRGYTSIKTHALKLFDMIESIDLNSFMNDYIVDDNQDVEIVPDDDISDDEDC